MNALIRISSVVVVAPPWCASAVAARPAHTLGMSTNTANRRRQPAGQPLGGAFAAESKPGAGVSLAEPAARSAPTTAQVKEAAINAALALHRGDYTLATSDPGDDEYGRTWVRATGDYGGAEQASVQVAINEDGYVGEVHAQRNLRTGKNGESLSGKSHRVLDTPVGVDDLPGVMDQVVADVQITQTQQMVIERDFNQAQDPDRLDRWEAQATAPDTVFFQRQDGRGGQAEVAWVRTDSHGTPQEVTLGAGAFQNLTLTGSGAVEATRQIGHYPQVTQDMLQTIAAHRGNTNGQ